MAIVGKQLVLEVLGVEKLIQTGGIIEITGYKINMRKIMETFIFGN